MSDINAPPPPPAPPIISKPKSNRPGWAMGVGVVCIVMASLFLVGGLYNLVEAATGYASTANSPGATAAQRDMLQGIVDVQLAHRLETVVVSVLSIPFAVWALVTGIAVIKMRPWARRSAVLYGWTDVVFTLIVSIAQIRQMTAIMDVLSDFVSSGSASDEMFVTIMRATMFVAFVVGIVFAFALPVFLLWWMHRRTIREQMATWGGDPQGSHSPYHAPLS